MRGEIKRGVATVSNTYNTIEKLKSRKLIGQLFDGGKTVSKFPVKIIYKKVDFEDEVLLKVGVSVSKRNFKHAVDRNRIKRLLRETYRLNKQLLHKDVTEKHVCMILYLGKKTPEYEVLNTIMVSLLQQLNEKINS